MFLRYGFVCLPQLFGVFGAAASFKLLVYGVLRVGFPEHSDDEKAIALLRIAQHIPADYVRRLVSVWAWLGADCDI